MNEDSPTQEKGSKPGYTGTVVLISGLFGLAAAGIMYFDALSKGEEYLQDSLSLIIVAAVLGAVTLIFGIYLYIKS